MSHRQVLTVALPLHVLGAGEVDQVIPNLEVEGQLVEQRGVISSVVAERLHQAHRQPEQPPSLFMGGGNTFRRGVVSEAASAVVARRGRAKKWRRKGQPRQGGRGLELAFSMYPSRDETEKKKKGRCVE